MFYLLMVRGAGSLHEYSSRAMLYKLAPAEAKNNQEEKTSLGTWNAQI